MPEIIDLSQEIYDGMAVFNRLPAVKIDVHITHEEWEGLENPSTQTPSVLKMELGEHTGTHVDALNHMGKETELKIAIGNFVYRVKRPSHR